MSKRDNKRTGAIIGAIAGIVAIGGTITGTAILIASGNSSKDSNPGSTKNAALVEVKREPIISYRQETETKNIDYGTNYYYDGTLEFGKTKLMTAGSYGTRTIRYKLTYKDDELVSREQISDEVTKRPTDTLIAIGTMNVWRCTDATSYDKNPYNDNYCEDSYGNSRYVSDSAARILDPNYIPGRSGHPYYNSF